EFSTNKYVGNKKIYCSADCRRGKYNSKKLLQEVVHLNVEEMVLANCEQCGGFFEKREKAVRRFCAPECSKKNRAEKRKTLTKEITCKYCSCTFLENEFSEKKYCSSECRKKGARVLIDAKRK